MSRSRKKTDPNVESKDEAVATATASAAPPSSPTASAAATSSPASALEVARAAAALHEEESAPAVAPTESKSVGAGAGEIKGEFDSEWNKDASLAANATLILSSYFSVMPYLFSGKCAENDALMATIVGMIALLDDVIAKAKKKFDKTLGTYTLLHNSVALFKSEESKKDELFKRLHYTIEKFDKEDSSLKSKINEIEQSSVKKMEVKNEFDGEWNNDASLLKNVEAILKNYIPSRPYFLTGKYPINGNYLTYIIATINKLKIESKEDEPLAIYMELREKIDYYQVQPNSTGESMRRLHYLIQRIEKEYPGVEASYEEKLTQEGAVTRFRKII